ncbi:hypothetical protein ACGRHY_05880 [Streptomyces sp. HK10]|uniref:hypothetical protein n=1 Tax=Streptomyces sp. HK10 TaxID=3373255 RepID=UPI0037478B6D
MAVFERATRPADGTVRLLVPVAARVIERPGPHEDGSPGRNSPLGVGGSNAEDAYRSRFGEATVLEARRPAARKRNEREPLDSRLETCLRSMGEMPGLPADASRRGRPPRSVVNRTAIRRLTDVSVTPRRSRRQVKTGDREGLEAG